MTFEKLSIGQRFEFVAKTKVGCGMWNGNATKKSSDTYVMDATYWITRTIGDKNVSVKKLTKKNLTNLR